MDIQELPNSPEAERELLGCILVDESLYKIASAQITHKYFYNLAHRNIYLAIEKLISSEIAISLSTVVTKLGDMGKLEEIEATYIAELMNSVTSTAIFQGPLKIVVEKYKSRRIMETAEKIKDECLVGFSEIRVERFKKEIEEVFNENLVNEPYRLSEDGETILADIEERRNMWKGGVPFSFTIGDMDSSTGGLSKQTLTVIGASPSEGKSSLCFQISYGLAKNSKCKVLHFSTEMSEKECRNRVFCSELDLNFFELIKLGKITPDEIARVRNFIKDLGKIDLMFYFKPGLRIQEVQREIENQKPDFVIIDFLQEMWTQTSDKNKELGEICKTLKKLACENNCGVIIASQFNRDKDRGEGRLVPQLSDLRDSGGIEITGDLIILFQKLKNSPSGFTKTYMHVAKNRSGPKTCIPTLFKGSCMRFLQGEWDDQEPE